MDSSSINLLPEERSEALRRQYFFRLGTLAALMLIALVVINSVLLYATHVYLAGEIRAHQAELAHVTTTINSADGAALDARLIALTAEAKLIAALPRNQSASALIAAVLALPRSGVVLRSFNYQPSGKGPATLVILGSASDRDALRAFDVTLTATPYISHVDLPVNAYASATDIDFTITLTLSKALFP